MNAVTAQAQAKWKNPVIGQARQAALELLKPTDAQYEHGLELHQQATVVEPYGFSAIANPDWQAVNKAIESGADATEIQWMVLRDHMTRMVDDPEQRELFKEAWEAAGVTCVLRNSGVEGNHPVHMMERLACNTYVLDHMQEFMVRAITAEDIRRAKRENKHAFMLQTNGVPLPQQWRSVESELRLISQFYYLGVRMMHLTYNRRNPIGDGCVESNDGGLSDFGRAVVAEMNRIGVIPDIAHSSPKTCLDTIACSTRPVMISHAACRSLHDHARGKSDDVIKALADAGGVMGICCVPNFLGRSGDIIAFLDHIDHAVKLVGADHVAIAPDFGTCAPGSDAPITNMPPSRREFEGGFQPTENEPFTAADHLELVQSMAWSNWPLFTVGLVQRGYSDEQIIKILGENVLRVLEANEPHGSTTNCESPASA